jgi:NADPH:quinone reductase-like Zn-dependent oxidoreductase
VHAASLRARPVEEKAAVCAATVEGLWPMVAAGTVTPVVAERLPMTEVARAHQILDESRHIGKVLLTRP